MNASCVPAAAPAAPATGGTETSTWGPRFSCRCGAPCLKQPKVLEDSGLLEATTCRGMLSSAMQYTGEISSVGSCSSQQI